MYSITPIESLQKLRDKIVLLRHKPKSDYAFEMAKGIANELRNLLSDNIDIRIDVSILDDYSYKNSDKRKLKIIEEFKKQTIFDINRLIPAN